MFHTEATKLEVVPKVKVRWKGVLVWNDLYRKMKWLLDSLGYGDERSNFKEIKYLERIKGDSKNLEIHWIGARSLNPYMLATIEITFLVVALKDVEMEKEGRKLKLNSADIDMRFNADLYINNDGRFKKGSMLQKLNDEFLMKSRIEEWKIFTYSKLYLVHDEVKTMLNLLNY